MPEIESDEKRMKTYMSQVFFKSLAVDKPSPLKKTQREGGESEIYLLDELLGGGIVIPNDVIEARLGTNDDSPTYAKCPGLLMLVTGEPGSGKSTFALELCYRLSLFESDNSALHKNFKKGISSIYISAEASARSLIQNAVSYGWKKEAFQVLPQNPIQINETQNRVFVFGRDMTGDRVNTPDKVFDFINENWETYFPDVHISKKDKDEGLTYYRPQVLVIDSLNTLGQASANTMKKMLELCSTRFLIIIAILDTGPGICLEHQWNPSEYLADIEIDFKYDRPENYLIRNMWVVKARFQDHADGFHRMKINPKPSKYATPNPLNPLIEEGGIFVFPSIHRHLSIARKAIDEARDANNEEGNTGQNERFPKPIETPFSALNHAIQGNGFPSGKCSLIVGDRGGMKSHLAYYTLLRFLINNPEERAIIISLRDTRDAAESTLAGILFQQVDDDGKKLIPSISNINDAEKYIRKELVNDDRLDIQYHWPGYISPEEFFHLINTSVDRPGINNENKQLKPASFVVINGIEQLSARFPLCSKENMFVAGLLSMLTVKGITVLVTSGGIANLPSNQGGVPQGLLPMSDLIIETSFRLLPAQSIWSSGVWFPDLSGKKYNTPVAETIAKKERAAKNEEPHVTYEIIREPGARECRRRVLFYMGREGDPRGFVRGSVYVRPLPDEFPHGSRLE